MIPMFQKPDKRVSWPLVTYCTTPSKLVYNPMGAEHAADRTIAQQWCHNKYYEKNSKNTKQRFVFW